MSQYETRQETEAQLLYREDKCGFRWPVAFLAALGWVLFTVCGALMFVPDLPGLGIIAGIGGILALIMTAGLNLSLAIGIRVDADGIHIGGMNARDRRVRKGKWPPRKPPKCLEQYKATFTCPWEGVRSLYVITEKPELKHIHGDRKRFLKSYDGLVIPLGVFFPIWFTKAELVITHNAIDAASDPPTFRRMRGRYGRLTGVESPTWMIPTNHPEALKAALERAPGAPRVQDRLPPEAIFQFKSGPGRVR